MGNGLAEAMERPKAKGRNGEVRAWMKRSNEGTPFEESREPEGIRPWIWRWQSSSKIPLTFTRQRNQDHLTFQSVRGSRDTIENINAEANTVHPFRKKPAADCDKDYYIYPTTLFRKVSCTGCWARRARRHGTPSPRPRRGRTTNFRGLKDRTDFRYQRTRPSQATRPYFPSILRSLLSSRSGTTPSPALSQ